MDNERLIIGIIRNISLPSPDIVELGIYNESIGLHAALIFNKYRRRMCITSMCKTTSGFISNSV